MSDPVRNRIKGHRRVRAGDLVPHEWNYRLHPGAQRDALAALYREVGFARSLLAFELPDGRLKLIDGHLRAEMSPDMMVDVEVLDVDEAEARTLLLSIDPLAELARMQEQLHERLRQLTPAADPDLAALWDEAARRGREAERREPRPIPQEIPDRYMILITCRDEKHQVELLARLHADGLDCKALMS